MIGSKAEAARAMVARPGRRAGTPGTRSPAASPPERRRGLWPLVALGAYSVVAIVIAGHGSADEGWFLQVAHRVASGEALYRDVFFGAPPLAVWLVSPLVALFGPHFVLLRLIAAALFVVTGVLVLAIARLLGAGAPRRRAVLLGLLAFAPSLSHSTYTALSMTLFLGATYASMRWIQDADRSRRFIVLASIAAGCSIASKHTVGALALAVVCAAVVAGARRRRAWLAVRVVAGAIASAVVWLIPVFVHSGAGKLVEYTVTAKSRYVELGSVSYLDGMRSVLTPGAHAISYAAFLVAPVALAVFVRAWRRAPADRAVLLVAGLTGALAVAGAYPRFDLTHVRFAVPALLPLFCVAPRPHASAGAHRGRRALAFVAAGGLLLAAALPARVFAADVAGGRIGWSGAAVYAGLPVRAPSDRVIMRTARELSDTAREGPLFVLSRWAGRLYLVSGVANPTPFDYPVATAFGRTGQSEVARRIAAGDLRVCLDAKGMEGSEVLRPAELEHAIHYRLAAGPTVPGCTLYRPFR